MIVQFAAHEYFRAWQQALRFLKERYDCPTIPLTGEDPCPPTEGRLFVRGSHDWAYPGIYGPYFCCQRIAPPPRDADSLWETRLSWLISSMPWATRAGEVMFINPRYLNTRGEFETEGLAGFHRKLRDLVRPPAIH